MGRRPQRMCNAPVDPASDPPPPAPPAAVPFRVLLCTPADVTDDAGWAAALPGTSVRGVTPAALSAGGWDVAGRPAWPKVACRLAVEGGFDAVVFADRAATPYDLARVRAVVTALSAGGAELARHGPTTGGWAGRLAARLIGRRSGPAAVRGYAAPLLRRVPFDLNADGDLFEHQLLLQALHVDAAVADLGTADGETATGDAARPFARLATTAQFRLHRMGMLCALRYRNLTPVRYRDKTFMLYTSHAVALRLVRAEPTRTLLDVGCGPGFIAHRCRADGTRVTGLDAHDPLPGMVDEFHRVDLERDELPVDPFAFDCVLMLDVLEHLSDPESFLVGLRNRTEAAPRPGGAAARVIISTPNVAFAAVRLNLLLGRFNYAERGILDVTHKRLFTRRSLLAMLRDCGYAVERTVAVGAPFQTVCGGRAGRALGAVADALAQAWPSMFAFQVVVVARPRPGVRQRLRDRPALLALAGRR